MTRLEGGSNEGRGQTITNNFFGVSEIVNEYGAVSNQITGSK
jgi:hypothetical protein